MRKLVLSVFTVLFSISLMGQGVTTAAMNGRVTDKNGEPLVGATVVAVLESTGSQFGTITDNKGFFNIVNMDIGGPYTLTVRYIGYDEYTLPEVYLTLGQTFRVQVNLDEASVELDEIVVVGRTNDYNIIDGNRTGAETVVGVEQIEAMPTVGRNLTDFTRLTPQARLEGDDGISIAGINNRYNSIYIDGAVNNDVFGLASSGTNGGQTGAGPISTDVIEQFQVVLAPYDVRQSGFAGGGINAVTRRGTNDVKASAYYFYRDENFAGKTPTDDTDADREKLAPFSAKTYGARIGGPIIKNKLFYFVSFEQQRDETPQPWDKSGYLGDDGISSMDQILSKLNGFGYDPGGFENNIESLESDRLFARIDWNINDVHKLMVRTSYTNSTSISPSRSSNYSINFANRGVNFPSTTISSALELKSNFNNKIANSLIAGFTSVRDDRDPIGSEFPAVRINDGDGSISFGSEPYSTANQLDQDILTITENLSIFAGKHTFTVGANLEIASVYNLFMRKAFGEYIYNSVPEFLNGDPAYQYERGYSLVDNIYGDGSAAAADFNTFQFGVYAQDEFQVNNNLKLTFGVRLDVPMYTDDPQEDTYFNNTTVGLIEAEGHDLEGARSGQMPKSQLLFSPRFGFNWDVNGDQKTQVRGGAGIFTSRLPLVWPGGSYTNNGLTIGGVYHRSSWGQDIVFEPDVTKQYTNQDFGAEDVVPSGQMDLFSEDFKFPQILRFNLGIDQQLPWGVIATVEGLFSKTLNNVNYKNLNVEASDGNYTGTGDNRPTYPGGSVDNTYTRIMLGTNTNEGYSYNLTAQLQKRFEKGFTGSIAYTFGRAMVINDGTSSQNSSQWRYMETPGDKNDLPLSISDFDLGSRIVGMLSYQVEYLKHLKTTFSLFYNGQSGMVYSYIYGNPWNLRGQSTDWDDLVYIPTSETDIVLTSGNWNELNDFIEGDDYLKDNRGEIAERNSNRTPFEHNFDLKIAQDIFVNTADRRQTLQLTIDVFNLGNLINPDWGRKYYLSNNNYSLLTAEGMDGNTPSFSFRNPNGDIWNIDDSGLISSRWKAQIGVRYIF